MTKTIDTPILDILRAGRCEGSRYYLPPTRLDPKVYKKVNEVLAALGGKWTSGKTQAHVFDGDAGEILAPTLGSGIKPISAQKEFQAFFTPRDVADKVAMAAREWTNPGARVLEPSCGDGALIAAYLDTALPAGVTIDGVEIQPKHAEAARARFAHDKRVRSIRTGDVFSQKLDPRGYRIVICNPPFNVAGDSLAWVTHTFYYINTLLAPGGRIVGIAPNSLRFRNTRVIAELRHAIDAHGYMIDLGHGAFGESGTETGTVLFVYNKPL